jgi:hypothetical protein
MHPVIKFGALLLAAKILAIVIGISWGSYAYGCDVPPEPDPPPKPVPWPTRIV